MPKVEVTGEIDKDTPGYSFLGEQDVKIALGFAGSTIPAGIEVGYRDDSGTFRPFTVNGAVSGATEVTVGAVNKNGIVVNSPNAPGADFYITYLGPAGPLSAS
jgi:hypothetical protein